MRKLLISVLSLFAVTNAATAQKITVADVEALPGETVSFTMTVDVQSGNYVGFQSTSMQFPSTGFTIKEGTANNAWSGGNVMAGNLDEEGKANLSVFSGSDTPIPDGEFIIGSLSFTVDAGLALGEYDVTISDIKFLDGTNYYPAPDVTFKVFVVKNHNVILDESATEAPAAATDVNVKVNRTIKANEWSTICLPFAMTEAQVNAGFGEDVQVQLGDFTGYETEEDAEENIVGIKVIFNNVTAIEANHPYIIKVNKPVTQIIAEEVNIAPEDEPAVSLGETTGSGKNKKYHPMDFNGTYVADFDFYNAATSTPLFLSSGNKFYYATENTKFMKAFRAYFDFDDVLASVDASRIVLSLNNETSGISQIENKAMKNENVFDLQGRRVSQSQKGLYIKGGKKVIMK